MLYNVTVDINGRENTFIR